MELEVIDSITTHQSLEYPGRIRSNFDIHCHHASDFHVFIVDKHVVVEGELDVVTIVPITKLLQRRIAALLFILDKDCCEDRVN